MSKYILFSFTCIFTTPILGMEPAMPAARLLKKQPSGILPKIKHKKTLSGSSLGNYSVNKEVEELTHDYKRDAVEAIFESDSEKFDKALEKINNPGERVQLRIEWNLLRGKKIESARKFSEYKGSHVKNSVKNLTNQNEAE